MFATDLRRLARRLGAGAGLLGLVLALGASIGSGGVAPGRTAPGAAHLPTVVSLNPCADAILAEVADPDQVLAISHYSTDPRSSSLTPDQAGRFRSTRGTVEEVYTLGPDLVIEGSFIAPATASAYARLGLRLETVGTVNTVDEARAQVRRLAGLVGHADRGERLVARMDEALAAAAPPPGKRPISAVMWESGGMVPGDDTLIAELMRRTGFTNASAASGYRQADLLPLERLLADPPQVIFTASAGEGQASDSDRVLAHPALASLVGVRRAKFSPTLLYCAGPTVIRAAGQLAAERRRMFGA